VEVGLDVLLREGLGGGAPKSVGLISNQTAVDRRFRSCIDLLHESSAVDVRALFGPEHGVRGEAQAGVAVADGTDPHTGLPVHSLYGATRSPSAEMLKDLDALVFDVQDAGVRNYTYLATLLYSLEEAAKQGVEFVVLDRPNPIRGSVVAGGLVDPQFLSFVGPYTIPIQHGLTMGEAARLYACERGLPEPRVVAMRGWQRDLWFDETHLPWVQPSPNLPTMDSLTLYPATFLIQGTNVSEGRGTTRPFEVVGAPWLDPFALAEELSSRSLDGVAFRPCYFIPMFSKFAGESCSGIQIHVQDRTEFRPVDAGIHLVDAIRRLQPSEFRWRQTSTGAYRIDSYFGSSGTRLSLDARAPVERILADWHAQAEAFDERRQPFLIYG
jgi:uncharacterized protein YbbC (DUF1343 family)